MICDYCGAEGKMDKEHMIPRSMGGTDHWSNLALACRPCNSQKGAQIGVWLPCGRAAWRDDFCRDIRCLKCAPAQLAEEGRMLQLKALRCRWARRRRDESIREAVAAGHSLRTVASWANLSHAAIARIVKRG